MSETVKNTVTLYQRGLSITDIVKARSLSESTVHGHLMKWYLKGGDIDVAAVLPREEERIILRAMSECDDPTRLGFIKEKCPDSVTYDDIRWLVAKLTRARS